LFTCSRNSSSVPIANEPRFTVEPTALVWLLNTKVLVFARYRSLLYDAELPS
jgi:hypothetical protein